MNGKEITATVLSALALILTLVAALSPGWLLNTIGLFYHCIGTHCAFTTSFTPLLTTILVITGLAVLLQLVGMGFALAGWRSNKYKHFQTSGSLVMLGGILVFITPAVYTAQTVNQYQSLLPVIKLFGYSYWCAWVAGLLAVVGGLLNVFPLKQ